MLVVEKLFWKSLRLYFLDSKVVWRNEGPDSPSHESSMVLHHLRYRWFFVRHFELELSLLCILLFAFSSLDVVIGLCPQYSFIVFPNPFVCTLGLCRWHLCLAAIMDLHCSEPFCLRFALLTSSHASFAILVDHSLENVRLRFLCLTLSLVCGGTFGSLLFQTISIQYLVVKVSVVTVPSNSLWEFWASEFSIFCWWRYHSCLVVVWVRHPFKLNYFQFLFVTSNISVVSVAVLVSFESGCSCFLCWCCWHVSVFAMLVFIVSKSFKLNFSLSRCSFI